VHLAALQAPDEDGVRRTKAVIVRNTAPQLRDTTIVSWNYWFKDGVAGKWRATERNFNLKFGDVECEVMFRPLDTPDDVARVLSLEVTFAILDEFVKIPKQVVEALSARLGRFPRNATNWGMWGSSNPDTEDNWWFEHLHGNPDVARAFLDENAQKAHDALNPPVASCNALYFVQPSGFGPDAENLINLPPRDGTNAYYINQAKGKSLGWVKQFIDAEWGYSAEGTPVVPTFNPAMHLSKGPLKFNPGLDLIICLDPGLAGSAMVFGQEDLNGRLIVLGELCQSNMGSTRLVQERLKPYLRARFTGARVIIAPDPAAANRGPNDEKTVVDEFKKHFDVSCESNNRLPLRLNAIEHFTTRLTGVGPALLVDGEQCPNLVRALKGGWRYVIDRKNGMSKAEPDDNPWSHVGDGFGYLARYFHRQFERESRSAKFIIPQFKNPGYHYR